MAAAVGVYSKVGQFVSCYGRIAVNSLSGVTTSEAARITGLPFTILNVASAQGVCSIDGESLAITAGTCVTGRFLNNTTHVDLRLWDATGGVTSLLVSELTADGELLFSVNYRTAS